MFGLPEIRIFKNFDEPSAFLIISCYRENLKMKQTIREFGFAKALGARSNKHGAFLERW
ncbi:MAG: hypothetical protein LBB59_03490 [Campylobacteraceae bacterium]|jgi:hypothetical protein|nr:hypothetical protein [Campylobacteraceae bacterium]